MYYSLFLWLKSEPVITVLRSVTIIIRVLCFIGIAGLFEVNSPWSASFVYLVIGISVMYLVYRLDKILAGFEAKAKN